MSALAVVRWIPVRQPFRAELLRVSFTITPRLHSIMPTMMVARSGATIAISAAAMPRRMLLPAPLPWLLEQRKGSIIARTPKTQLDRHIAALSPESLSAHGELTLQRPGCPDTEVPQAGNIDLEPRGHPRNVACRDGYHHAYLAVRRHVLRFRHVSRAVVDDHLRRVARNAK